MTTNEVIKGLECCKKGDCDGCPYKKYRTYGCDGVLREDALKHLQQQKCEVEKLQVECLALKQKRLNLFERLDFIRNARREVALEISEEIERNIYAIETPYNTLHCIPDGFIAELKKKYTEA